jgi:hypothetical protein
VQGSPEPGLSLTLLSPLLKRTNHRLTKRSASVVDGSLPDRSSAAICLTVTTFTNYCREGSTSTVIQPAFVSNVVSQHNKNRRHYFRSASPIYRTIRLYITHNGTTVALLVGQPKCTILHFSLFTSVYTPMNSSPHSPSCQSKGACVDTGPTTCLSDSINLY